MTPDPKRRVEQLSGQLQAPRPSNEGSVEGIPSPQKYSDDGRTDRLTSKIIILTGANSPLGIGLASAHQYAQHGARALYLCDLDSTHLPTHAHKLSALYPDVEIHTRQFDAADEEAVREVVQHALERYGRLDVFLANAGTVGRNRVFGEVGGEEFMRTLRTNVLSVFLAAKYAAPAMKRTSADKPTASGSIIGMASVAGLRSNAGSTDYSASKAAVISIVQTIAWQLYGTGIRCNAICPGLIETGMTSAMFEQARARGTEKNVGQLNPAKRAGHADEVARVALFLGSDDSSYVNGQAWAVDGGLSAGLPFVLGKLA